ncbi:protein MtfA [mine drainage metagenome]|uniref:Protein MtfA n=1 Tax=mine drainage metagenome TaxID=410659 RepID=A0A1J5RF35_9ZZZZ
MHPLNIALRRWRIRRILKHHPIPHSLWNSVTRRILVLDGLDAVQMSHLREMTARFLQRKLITGAQGLEVTPSMRVTVAAQACLLILNLGMEYFDGWIEVILYPGAFRVRHAGVDAIGLVHDNASVLTGESWLRGPVILSWEDVERDACQHSPGHNVVLHEFAHKLDGLNGVTNGMPPLRRGMSGKGWSEGLGGAYDVLCRQLAAGKATLINPYAATSPAEFFAVLSEYFFTAPDLLKHFSPSAHRQLTLFYRQPQTR